MRELQKQDTIFSRYELSLGPEKRLFYLEVVKLGEFKHKYYLIDFYGWPVTDLDLNTEAIILFKKFKVENT